MPARALMAWYETFPTAREGALDRLEEHFAADVHFRDPFRQTTGIPAFKQLFVSMFGRYRHVEFTGWHVEGDDRAFTLTYDMHLRMAIGPTFTTPMCSVCTVRDGKIATLVDYYDFATGLVSPFPLLGRIYRGVINGLFL